MACLVWSTRILSSPLAIKDFDFPLLKAEGGPPLNNYAVSLFHSLLVISCEPK